jgi:hypothetical protein
MTVASTPTLSRSVSGFNDIGRFTQRARLMRFLFVGPALCLRLPSDSTSRWTPLPFGYAVPLIGPAKVFHLLVLRHAGRTNKKGARRTLLTPFS